MAEVIDTVKGRHYFNCESPNKGNPKFIIKPYIIQVKVGEWVKNPLDGDLIHTFTEDGGLITLQRGHIEPQPHRYCKDIDLWS